jgi:hypothetical protein
MYEVFLLIALWFAILQLLHIICNFRQTSKMDIETKMNHLNIKQLDEGKI